MATTHDQYWLDVRNQASRLSRTARSVQVAQLQLEGAHQNQIGSLSDALDAARTMARSDGAARSATSIRTTVREIRGHLAVAEEHREDGLAVAQHTSRAVSELASAAAEVRALGAPEADSSLYAALAHDHWRINRPADLERIAVDPQYDGAQDYFDEMGNFLHRQVQERTAVAGESSGWLHYEEPGVLPQRLQAPEDRVLQELIEQYPAEDADDSDVIPTPTALDRYRAARLVARDVDDHLDLAHLGLDENPGREAFQPRILDVLNRIENPEPTNLWQRLTRTARPHQQDLDELSGLLNELYMMPFDEDPNIRDMANSTVETSLGDIARSCDDLALINAHPLNFVEEINEWDRDVDSALAELSELPGLDSVDWSRHQFHSLGGRDMKSATIRAVTDGGKVWFRADTSGNYTTRADTLGGQELSAEGLAQHLGIPRESALAIAEKLPPALGNALEEYNTAHQPGAAPTRSLTPENYQEPRSSSSPAPAGLHPQGDSIRNAAFPDLANQKRQEVTSVNQNPTPAASTPVRDALIDHYSRTTGASRSDASNLLDLHVDRFRSSDLANSLAVDGFVPTYPSPEHPVQAYRGDNVPDFADPTLSSGTRERTLALMAAKDLASEQVNNAVTAVAERLPYAEIDQLNQGPGSSPAQQIVLGERYPERQQDAVSIDPTDPGATWTFTSGDGQTRTESTFSLDADPGPVADWVSNQALAAGSPNYIEWETARIQQANGFTGGITTAGEHTEQMIIQSAANGARPEVTSATQHQQGGAGR